MTTFRNLLLKQKPVELQGRLSPSGKIEMTMMYICNICMINFYRYKVVISRLKNQ